MLHSFLLFSLFSIAVSKECQKRLPAMCTTCCALLYDNDDCDTENLFRVKWGADGFLGAIWERQSRVVEVYPGCLLTLWEMRNQTGQSRALGLDGYNVYYLERYAFSQRASSLTCKCTSAAGKPPTTTPKPENEKEIQPPVVSESDNQDTAPIDVSPPKEGGAEESESGYGSEPEGHLEEVKSLEDLGTGEEQASRQDDKKEGAEDSQEDSNEEESDSSTTVLPAESDGAEGGADSPPSPSVFSVPSLSHPITHITMTPPIREIPLTIQRLLMSKSSNNTVDG